jgi:hypothetical protein
MRPAAYSMQYATTRPETLDRGWSLNCVFPRGPGGVPPGGRGGEGATHLHDASPAERGEYRPEGGEGGG